MKTYKIYIIISILMLLLNNSKGQTMNWGSLQSNTKHIINANAGIQHGTIFGVGYGYHIKNKLFPMIANVEYSFPSGENLIDDLKIRTGVEISWVEFHHFQFSTNLHGVIRRYENDNVRLVNFGSDMSGILGYYRHSWFAAGEFGFDKAIITHYKHTAAYKDQYPGVSDGWFGPTTGGNFYYGVQAGVSFGKMDIYLKAGKLATQDWKTLPTLPFYGQIGFNLKM